MVFVAGNTTQPCYIWDGTPADWVYTPCNPSEAYSMCCRTLQNEGAPAPDYCLPNGLCSNFDPETMDLGSQTFWIESCTDPSWASDACAPLAKYMQETPTCEKDINGNSQLHFCPQTKTYCCNQYSQSSNCCDMNVRGNMAVDVPIASIISTTTSFAGSTYTTVLPTLLKTSTPASSRTTSTPVATSKSGNGTKLSVGDGVGVGIGAAAVFFILLTVAYVFWRRRRGKGAVYDYRASKIGRDNNKVAAELHQDSVVEVHGSDRKHELSNHAYGFERHELR